MDPWAIPMKHGPKPCRPLMRTELTNMFGPLHWSTHLLGDIVEDTLYSTEHVDDKADAIVSLLGEDLAFMVVAAHPSEQANNTLFAMLTNKLIDEL